MESNQPRIIFMGTPDFAVPALERLAMAEDAELALVVTQPDRPSGRGKKMSSPAVKLAADRMGVPVLQTGTLRDLEIRQRIIDVRPDLIVVAAFGMVLGKWILELPIRGCVNLHASLLPKYRGANPIAAAIAQGERETGVSLMHMDRGLDTGPVYAMSRLEIEPDDTTESLTPKLAHVAGDLLHGNLAALLSGDLRAEPQRPGATLTRPMRKDDGWIDFSRPAVDISCHVRAMWPWPRAWSTTSDGTRIQIHEVAALSEPAVSAGRIAHLGKRVVVGAGDGATELLRVQLPGGKPIEGEAIVQSASFADGAMLGETGAPDERSPLVEDIREE